MLGKQEARVWRPQSRPAEVSPSPDLAAPGRGLSSRNWVEWSEGPDPLMMPRDRRRGPSARLGLLPAQAFWVPVCRLSSFLAFPWAWGPGGGSGHNSRPEGPEARPESTLSLTPTGGCLVEGGPRARLRRAPGNLLPRRRRHAQARNAPPRRPWAAAKGLGKGCPGGCGCSPEPQALP